MCNYNKTQYYKAEQSNVASKTIKHYIAQMPHVRYEDSCYIGYWEITDK